MRRSIKICFILILLSFLTAAQPAAAFESGPPEQIDEATQSIIDKYRTLILQEMRKQHIPGMAISIVDNNEVVWSEGFGYTDWDHKMPVTADTPFSIQSMSKSFTAAAVMFAFQEGLVDLDTPISQYLPGFHVNSIFEDYPEDTITLRHLLSHTAGFTHDAQVGNNNDLGPSSWEEHVASMPNSWLLFPVGERYNYSNIGIDLAAHIVEVRAGMPFTQYIKSHLLEPLGMTHSTLDIEVIRAMTDRAIGHSAFFRPVPLSPIMAAGGVYTSANDMARYLLFYLNLGKVHLGLPQEAQVLSIDLVKAMYNGQFPASAEVGYGMGLTYYRAQDATSTLEIEHGGGGFGFLSDMIWFPQIKFGVVWLTNTSDHNLQSWLTGQIINDYIQSKQSVMALRAYNSQPFNQKTFGPQDPPILPDEELVKLVYSKALPDDVQAVNRRREFAGIYKIDAWGRTGELHVVRVKNGELTLDGAGMSEVQPGLFFARDGESLDLRGPVLYYQNKQLEKIGLVTVIFYVAFLGFCGIFCLALLIWPPLRWAWSKIRHTALLSRPALPTRMGNIFIILAGLVGLLIFGGLVKFPILILEGIPPPTPNLPTYQYFFSSAHISSWVWP